MPPVLLNELRAAMPEMAAVIGPPCSDDVVDVAARQAQGGERPQGRVGGDEDTGLDHERVAAAVLPAVVAGWCLQLVRLAVWGSCSGQQVPD